MPNAHESPRCVSCVFWGRRRWAKDDTVPSLARFRICGAVYHGRAVYEDDDRAVPTVREIVYERSGDAAHQYGMPVAESAYVQDGSGFYAALKTAEDFGCVMHQRKP